MRRSKTAASMALALALISGGVALGHHSTRPTHIHAGVCPAPGDIVVTLSDTGAIEGEAAGQASAIPVETATSTVGLSLSEIVASAHAIVVHDSVFELGTYLVCGDLGGVPEEVEQGTRLLTGLGPVGGSTFSGVGVLTDSGDGMTTITVYVMDSAAMMMEEA